MTIRDQTENIEKQILHPKAKKSLESKGRLFPEKEGSIRTCFQRDRDRIIHSKAFRRLKHKTQVFLAPKGDHYRTRLTHVLEVSQIARTIAKALRLNEDLTEAIALGHDLGHPPFGHAGEAVLNEIYSGGFDHCKQSLRVVNVLERKGKGLNLTYEVRDGILTHSKGKGEIIPRKKELLAETLEGQIVRISDIIAYVNHDLDDALRAGVITVDEIPKEISETLGDNHSKRIDTMVKDVIYSTMDIDYNHINMSENIMNMVYKLRDFLFKNVYESEQVIKESKKAKKILKDLYEYYLKCPEEILLDIPKDIKPNKYRLACDFIAGMTDSFALMTYERIFHR